MAEDPSHVEIKISYGDGGVGAARRAFDLDEDDGRDLEIWFCEDIERDAGEVRLRLAAAGLIVRLRRKKGGEDDDTTVKVRRPDLSLATTVPGADLKVEGDWTTSGRQVSASISQDVPEGLIRPKVLAKGLDGDLFSSAQAELFASNGAPDLRRLEDLHPLGPIEAVKWDPTRMGGFDRDVAAEQWSVDELRFLELSIRVPFDAAEAALVSFEEWADGRGEGLTTLSTPKTATVLEHFASQLDE